MSKAKKKKKVTPNQQTSSSKWIFWVIGIIAVCILGLIVLSNISKGGGDEKAALTYDNQPYLGKESAPVEVVEFGDYKCPACKNFTESFFPLIQKDYVDTGKVKFYFMNYAFINNDSSRAAEFAETVYKELGNDTFWKFHELLYKKQNAADEKKDVLTESYLEDTLKEVSSDADAKKVASAFKDGKGKDAFDQDMKTANNLGITGTPTIYVGGKKFEGKTIDDFDQMVKDAAKENK
ncbi:DsbA family protein [Priestia megaterium]|uniref:DsbA family protein n=1 Tax=Priestia megaterium TaxID=1404 RepID=UPI003CF41C97